MRLCGMLVVVFFVVTVVNAEDQELVTNTRLLETGSLAEKTKAARLIGEIGPAATDAVPSLLKSLETDNAGLRHEVAVALGNIGSAPKQVVPALIRYLSDPQPVVRHGVIDALRKYGSDAQSAVPELKNLLKDKELLISVIAARAIVEIESGKGENVAQATPVLIAGLNSENQDISATAVQGLVIIGPSTVSAIKEVVGGKNIAASMNASDALAAMGSDSAPALDRLMSVAGKSSTAQLRLHAMNAIGDIGTAAKPAVPLLIEALGDSDSQVKFTAEQALQKIGKPAVASLVKSLENEPLQKQVATIITGIGPSAGEAVPTLARLLGSKDAETRREVILALAAIGPDAKSTVGDLTKLLKDKKFPNRPAAAFALGKIGAKEAIPALQEGLETQENQTLRIACVWSLLQLDPTNNDYAKAAVPLLTTALDNDRPAVRIEAARSLARLGSRAKSAATTLKKKLSDPNPSVRRESLIALAEIGPDASVAVSDITPFLNEGDPSLRPIACYALGRLGAASKSAVPQLQRMLFSRDAHEKTVAAWALASISPDPQTIESTIPILTEALVATGNPEVRLELVKILGKIGSGSAAVKTALGAALKDPEESVRKAAEAAISQLK